jgi:ParB family transcriptional regulator, chromosome partitioning protein
MTTKKRGLGRGLDALLGTGNASSQKTRAEQKNEAAVEVAISPEVAAEPGQPGNSGDENNSLKYLPVEFIQPGKYQPRLDMRPESLEELANSIKAQGVMQPIVVRSISSDMYEIVACQPAGRIGQDSRHNQAGR